MSHDQKISSFTSQAAFQDTDLITFVRSGTNFNGAFSTLKLSLGVTGTLNPVGDGVPVLEQPVAGTNNIRDIESGAGIIASVSPENGITLDWNVLQDSVGEPLTTGLTDAKPVICSVVAGLGISIVKAGNTLVFNNTVDPATGLSNRVVVTEASDLSGTLDHTKEYFIDGIVDMGSQSVEVPQGGLNLTGYNFHISKLISNEAG